MKSDFAKKVFLYKRNMLPIDEKEALEKEMANNDLVNEAVQGLLKMDESEYLDGYKNYVNKIESLQKRGNKIKFINPYTVITTIAATVLFIIIFNIGIKDSTNSAIVEEKPLLNISTEIDTNQNHGVNKINRQDNYAKSGVVNTTSIEEDSFSNIVDNSKPNQPMNFQKYLKENLRYPQNQENSTISGIVVLNVEIKRDGSIGTIEIKKGLNDDFNKEAIRVMKNCPKWEPAIVNKDTIDCFNIVEIAF